MALFLTEHVVLHTVETETEKRKGNGQILIQIYTITTDGLIISVQYDQGSYALRA